MIHSLYAAFLPPDDQDVYDAVTVGRMEDEIKLLKIKLRGALKGQAMWEAQQEELAAEDQEDALPLVRAEKDTRCDVDETTGKARRTERKKTLRRKRDFLDEILRISNTISRLEIRHAALVERARETGAISTLAEELRRFGDEAAATLPGEGDADDDRRTTDDA